MITHLQTKFEIKSWNEEPYQELPEGQQLKQATVALAADTNEVAGEASMAMLLHYRADGTSVYLTQLHLQGRLGGRTGSVVLQGTGSYDGASARGRFTVVPGSGTGELTGASGRAESTSTHADYPFMPLTLELEVV